MERPTTGQYEDEGDAMRQLEVRNPTGTAYRCDPVLDRAGGALLGIDGVAVAGVWGSVRDRRASGAPGSSQPRTRADGGQRGDRVLGGTMGDVETERERLRERIMVASRRKAHRRARRQGHRIR